MNLLLAFLSPILSILQSYWVSADNLTGDVSKMVAITFPQSQNFYAGTGNLNKIVNVVFAVELAKQDPSCVLDKNTQNVTIAGQVSSPFVISCDLSNVSPLAVGQHQLWVVRSPEWRQSTLQSQTPIQLNILPEPSITSANAVEMVAKPAAAAQWMLTLNPVAAKFSDQVDQIKVEMKVNGSNASNVSMECGQMVENGSTAKLGLNPNCSVIASSSAADGTILTGQIQLGENATIRVGDKLAFYSIRMASDSNPSANQTAKISLAIGNATNPTIPVISLISQNDVNAVNICAQNEIMVKLNASTREKSPLTCKWHLHIPNTVGTNMAKLFTSTNACSVAFSNKMLADLIKNLSYYPTPVAIEISVLACNLVGLCSATAKISLSLDSGQKLDASIGGLPSTSIPSARIPLSAKIGYSECGTEKAAPNISFIWFINGSPVSNSSVFTILPFAYSPPSVVPIKLVVKHESGLEAIDSRTITFQLEPIVPIVDANSRTISADSTLQLDASASWSQNVRDWPLAHSWRCVNLTDGKECSLGDVQMANNGLLSVGPGKLRENGSFLFVDAIQDSANATGQVAITIKVLPSNSPTIKLVEDAQSVAMPHGFYHVQAFVRNPIGNGGNLLLKWTLNGGTAGGNESLDLGNFFPNEAAKNLTVTENSGQTMVLSISLPINKSTEHSDWPGLLADQDYTLRLTATNAKGGRPAAYSEHQFRIHSLPALDKLVVIPADSIASLDTLVRIQPAGHFDTNSTGLFRVRFGIRYLLDGNASRDAWSRATIQNSMDGLYYETLLPTAWPQPHASCGQRIGFQGLFEICDRIWGRCMQLVSDNFTVGHFSIEMVGRAIFLLQDRLDNGDVFGSLELLDAVNQELCGQWKNTQLLNQILDSLMDLVGNSSDSEELLECVEYAMRLAETASSENLQQIMILLAQTKRALNMGGGNCAAPKESRRKREVPLVAGGGGGQQMTTTMATTTTKRMRIEASSTGTTVMTPKKITDTAATTLLIAYDLLLGRDQNVVQIYLSNIGDILSSFCTQVDSIRTMEAFGKSYTSIQAQGIEPNQPDFVNQTYTLAGNRSQILSFDPAFASLFSRWWCGNDKGQMCTQICLASAVTKLAAFGDNEYLRQQFFLPQYAMLTVEQAVSDFYHIYLLDPLTGSNVSTSSSQGFFSIRVNVSIANYHPSAYYKCFFYTGTQWNDSACESAVSAKMAAPGQFQLPCICHKAGGILGVFNVNPPTPPPYPAHNEIQLLFTLNTTQIPSPTQLSAFVDQLAKSTGINGRRFVALNATIPSPPNNSSSSPSSAIVISAKLRPPFSLEQLSNSYSMQALKRTINCDGGFTAYDNVLVLNMTHFVVKRVLAGDKNARRIPMRISRAFKETTGPNTNDSISTGLRWTSSMARNMRISEFRFKNPTIMMGVLFNFTITVPFEGESTAYDEAPLSAEEISKLIEEMSHYGELDLRDQRDQPLPVDPLSEQEIVELVVMNPTHPLTYWLGGIVALAITLSTFYIGTMVFLKLRCDRLIEQHNENMQIIDLSQAAPVNVLPFQPNGGRPMGGGGGMVDNMAGASTSTDTVVFGRTRRRRGQTKIDG